MPVPKRVLKSGYNPAGYQWQLDHWDCKWDCVGDCSLDRRDEELKI